MDPSEVGVSKLQSGIIVEFYVSALLNWMYWNWEKWMYSKTSMNGICKGKYLQVQLVDLGRCMVQNAHIYIVERNRGFIDNIVYIYTSTKSELEYSDVQTRLVIECSHINIILLWHDHMIYSSGGCPVTTLPWLQCYFILDSGALLMDYGKESC
jgi:hypothetical protein